MHIAFVSQFDAQDVRAWSGIPYYMAHRLAEHVDRVSIVAPLEGGRDPLGKLRVLRAKLNGKSFLRQHTRRVLQSYADDARRQLDSLRPDAVLAPSSLPVTLLDTDVPTALWCDATFESNLFTYADYSNLPDDLIVEANLLEEEALARVRLAFFAGEHAARSAVNYYGVDSAKVHIVPYGPNLDPVPDSDVVSEMIAARTFDRCNLLFIGKNWIRKGGDVAIKVAEALYRRGLDVTLTVVGGEPPLPHSLPYVRTLGYINKATVDGRRQFDRLLSESHFMLLPTRAENFGCVFSEGSAYGIPSLTTKVDGVPTAIRHNVNGLLFPARPDPKAIAEAVAELLGQPDRYRALARSSRREYEQRLNWRTATATVAKHLIEATR
jgi:glycosyltransferase involved in cell wall biosynthesis